MPKEVRKRNIFPKTPPNLILRHVITVENIIKDRFSTEFRTHSALFCYNWRLYFLFIFIYCSRIVFINEDFNTNEIREKLQVLMASRSIGTLRSADASGPDLPRSAARTRDDW